MVVITSPEYTFLPCTSGSSHVQLPREEDHKTQMLGNTHNFFFFSKQKGNTQNTMEKKHESYIFPSNNGSTANTEDIRNSMHSCHHHAIFFNSRSHIDTGHNKQRWIIHLLADRYCREITHLHKNTG